MFVIALAIYQLHNISRRGDVYRMRYLVSYIGNHKMAAKNTLSVKEHITCSICLEVYTNPLRLPCEHCFCKKCLLGLCSGDPGSDFKCPECRHHITVGLRGLDEFPKSLHLTNIVEVYAKQGETVPSTSHGQCMVCETHTPLGELNVCITCNKMTFCKDCQTNYHSKKGDFLRHQVGCYYR
jgi:hypothetical protein